MERRRRYVDQAVRHKSRVLTAQKYSEKYDEHKERKSIPVRRHELWESSAFQRFWIAFVCMLILLVLMIYNRDQ